MKEFFENLYGWFGFIPFYSRDLGTHLKGYDITCTGFIGTPWYIYIGWIMILLTGFIYILQYHIIDSPRLNKVRHWWIFAIITAALNFLIAFSITLKSVQAEDYCNQLKISFFDCIGLGISNAIWSLILFIIITTIPLIRRLSTNCRHTTFWKP